MAITYEKNRKGKMVAICIRLPSEVAGIVGGQSKHQGMSNSCYIRNIVLTALRSDGLLNNYDAAVDIDVPRSSGRDRS
jgi:predicted DNA-binding protein